MSNLTEQQIDLIFSALRYAQSQPHLFTDFCNWTFNTLEKVDSTSVIEKIDDIIAVIQLDD